MIPNCSTATSSRRVLLVEGSPIERAQLRPWLTAGTIETYEAVDIITALAACERFKPNLILLQLRLNTWDGYEVIRRLKQDPKTRAIPVIFLADSAFTTEKAKGIEMGAVDFLTKPFDPVEILARVNSALRTKALLDLLEQRAHLDGLTELGNRFALKEALPRELASCRERGRELSILMADLDHFKKVNDHFGHAAGDDVLRQAAAVMRICVRPSDLLFRYGGEEFVVLCPDCGLAPALQIGERIRTRIAEMKVPFRDTVIHMTSSLGIQCIEPSSPVEPPPASLERVDQALYRAKTAGRNAVWYWDVEREMPLAAAEREG